MQIKSFQGGYDKNLSYLVWCKHTKFAAIIDPSVSSNQIFEIFYFPKRGLAPVVFFSNGCAWVCIWFQKLPKPRTSPSDISDFPTKPKI